MTRIVWDQVGSRRFEAGVDRGVLYTTGGLGVPWNGLTSVKENPTGGEATPYYLDGVKYLNVTSREELEGNIEAFTYPDEFMAHDGSYFFSSGLIATQQARAPFALSYRTKYGNDVSGTDFGYRLHIIYNMVAKPAGREYGTIEDSTDPLKFSWDFTTTAVKPVSVTPLAPLAHVVLDSNRSGAALMKFIEELLYGNSKAAPQLISLNDLVHLFENPPSFYAINENKTTGLSPLTANPARVDLVGATSDGLFKAPEESRLIPTAIPGLYTMGA